MGRGAEERHSRVDAEIFMCNVVSLAGPVATIIAAIAAVLVTWRLGKGQLRIAEQQAAIAQQQAKTDLDQLRHNLFERRYAIYNAAKELIRYSVNYERPEDAPPLAGLDDLPDSKMMEYYTKLDEARFFFSTDVFQWLHMLRQQCDEYLRLRRTGTPRKAHPVVPG
jgi:hypothetical protein